MWLLHTLLQLHSLHNLHVHTIVQVCIRSVVLVLICHSLSSTVVIGWQLTSYQAAEGTATVTACAQVLNGAANIMGSISVQVSTNPGTALGKQK